MEAYKIILTEEQLIEMQVSLRNDLDYVKNQQKFIEELIQEQNGIGEVKRPDANLEYWIDREKSTLELIELVRKAERM